MGFFKILGCAVVGIGAVAAAPFTGGGSILGAASLAGSLAGTTAVVGAVGAGVVGGAIGAADSELDEDEKIEDQRRSFESGAKKGSSETEKKYAAKLADACQQSDFVVGAFALGYMFANCDGELAPEEEDEIQYLIGSVDKSGLPYATKNEIAKIKNNKRLKFDDITVYLDKIQSIKLSILDNFVEDIIKADGRTVAAEKNMRKEWKAYKNSRL